MLLRCRWFKRDCSRCNKVKRDGKSAIRRFVERVWRVRPKLLGFGDVSLMFDVGVKKSEDVSKNRDTLAKQNEVYKRFMQNPGLHQPCPDVNINNLILKSYPKQSAMHYASYLWNWNFKERAARSSSILKCTQKTLRFTIRNMKDSDLVITRSIIKDSYSTHLPSMERSYNLEKFRWLLISEIYSNPGIVGVLVEVIQKWYTVLPILEELSTCTSWKYICTTEACLLDVDSLYTIFLNIVYKIPQPNTL